MTRSCSPSRSWTAPATRDPFGGPRPSAWSCWVFVSAGDTQFVTNDVVAALERARSEGDVASQARCLYGIGLASPGQSEMFEPVHELATEAGNQRYAAYGALLAAGSLIGTAAGDPAFERAGRVAVGFDDETFELAYPGWMAQHLAWRGHPSRAVALAREALQHESRAIAAVFTVAAGAMSIALQVGDASLLRLAAESIPSELRQIPAPSGGSSSSTTGRNSSTPIASQSAIDPPPVLMLFLLASDLVLRLLLTDGSDGSTTPTRGPRRRPDLAAPTVRPAWRRRGRRSSAAIERPATASTTCSRRRSTWASHPSSRRPSNWSHSHLSGAGHHEQAARLLGSAAEYGPRRSSAACGGTPDQEHAVKSARQRLADALGESGLEEAVSDGARAACSPTPSTSPAACSRC